MVTPLRVVQQSDGNLIGYMKPYMNGTHAEWMLEQLVNGTHVEWMLRTG